MRMLADLVEVVVGFDTHTHTVAVLAAATGAMLDQATAAATPAGDQQLLALADRQPGQRIWAIESTGGDGAGLTRFLHANAERVVELDRPKRATRRHGAKSDPLDATRAAREALGRDQLAQPRAAGHRAALQVRLTACRSAVQAVGDAQRQLHALVVAAPEASADGCAASPLRVWSAPVGGCVSGATGTPRPPPLRPACAPWPAASNSSTPRPPSTPGPSPPWSGPGGPTCSPDPASARSWPPLCGVPGPMPAAAGPTPPSPCWAEPPPSPPPVARPSAFG
jgi:hypothetical protein